jgi:histone deacetylase HOS3
MSTIVERPERVRAIKAGLAVAISRLEGLYSTSQSPLSSSAEASNVDPSNPDDLARALDQMTLEASTVLSFKSKINPVQIVHSTASVDILNNAAVKYIHGDIDGDVYLEKLKDWMANSVDRISKGEPEIPIGLPQRDLYCESSPASTLSSLSLTIVSSVSRFVGCYSRSAGDGLRSR